MLKRTRQAARNAVNRREPPPPAEAPATFREQVDAFLARFPVLTRSRIFWNDVNDSRAWWPVLLPLLAWIGWRHYRHERHRILYDRMARQMLQAQLQEAQAEARNQQPAEEPGT